MIEVWQLLHLHWFFFARHVFLPARIHVQKQSMYLSLRVWCLRRRVCLLVSEFSSLCIWAIRLRAVVQGNKLRAC